MRLFNDEVPEDIQAKYLSLAETALERIKHNLPIPSDELDVLRAIVRISDSSRGASPLIENLPRCHTSGQLLCPCCGEHLGTEAPPLQ